MLITIANKIVNYRLPDGKSIQMVSALILQLIQSCTAGTNQYGSKEIDGQGRDEIFGIDIIGDINNLKKVYPPEPHCFFFFLFPFFLLLINI